MIPGIKNNVKNATNPVAINSSFLIYPQGPKFCVGWQRSTQFIFDLFGSLHLLVIETVKLHHLIPRPASNLSEKSSECFSVSVFALIKL